jgi:uronate dehydrogenase
MVVLITGAAGTIGSTVAAGLADEFDLRLTDKGDADLADPAAVDRVVRGAEAVVHLGAVADEAPFEQLAGPNLHGAFHVFDAARRHGVRRVVYASSNRITGFEPVTRRLAGDEPPRPDGLYAATKAWGEALGRLHADKYGIEVVSVRIGTFEPEPSEPRSRYTWLSPGDAVRLFRAALTGAVDGYVCVYGASANARGYWDLGPARALGYDPQDDAERYALGEETHPLQGGRFTEP